MSGNSWNRGGCAASLTRRQLLQVGGLGVLGLDLPELLMAGDGRGASGQRSRSEKSCIFIVQYGGASHHDSFDLKPDQPDDIRGPYRPIDTNVPGIRIGELLPRMAGLADRYALIRSMSHRNGGHDGGMHVCMTGRSNPEASTPYFGAVASRLRPSTQNIPSYVWLQNLAGDVQPRYLTGGFLGMAHSPLRIGTDLDNPSNPKFRVTAFDPPVGTSTGRLENQYKLLQQMQPSAGAAAESAHSLAFRRFQERALDLVTGTEARRAFDLGEEPAATRDRYGRYPLGQNLLMARRLIEAGVRLVSVTAWTGTPPGDTFRNVQTWDMHGNGAALGSIFGNGAFGLGWALPRLDEAVSALLEDLESRGLLESTLVVLVGEFGRSPRIVNAGRDHWPSCYSALLAGAGVRGGMVYGASDKQGAYVQDLPVSPEDFGATLFHILGIPPETRFGPDGFSLRVSDGNPVRDLLI